ncbi:MAG: hypothetical protein H7231_05365 [Rhodoferax sp.]|nr:hypothetical protein [Actinomycetota bacterium]
MSSRVHPRALAAVTVLCLLGMAPLLVAAPATARPASVDAGTDDVTWWLARASAAQSGLAWSGNRLVATWSSGLTTSSLDDVVHEPGRGLTVRAHAASSGTVAGGGHGQDVTMPDRPDGTSYLEAAAGAPAPLSLLMSHYDVSLDRPGQVAGRPAHSLLLRRSGSTAARLWLDDATGLLLRREVYDAAGRTTAAMAYLDVTVGPSPAPVTTTVALAARPGGVDAIRRSGWVCPAAIGSGGSDLVLYDARTLNATAGRTPIMHLTYSDGLSSLSVFEQQGTLDPVAVQGYAVTGSGSRRMHVRRGSPTQAVWQSGPTVVTVVSDAPTGQLAAVVAAMPSTPAPTTARAGWMATASRAVLRAARWVTPLR